MKQQEDFRKTPTYKFYRRLLFSLVLIPAAVMTGIAYIAYIRGGLFSNGPVYREGAAASGLDQHAIYMLGVAFDCLFFLACGFGLVKPKTEAGMKKTFVCLNFLIGIVGLLVSYLSLPNGYQAGVVGLVFAAYSLLISLITSLRA